MRYINVVFNNGTGQVSNLKLVLTSDVLTPDGWLKFGGIQEGGVTVEAAFNLKNVYYYFITSE